MEVATGYRLYCCLECSLRHLVGYSGIQEVRWDEHLDWPIRSALTSCFLVFNLFFEITFLHDHYMIRNYLLTVESGNSVKLLDQKRLGIVSVRIMVHEWPMASSSNLQLIVVQEEITEIDGKQVHFVYLTNSFCWFHCKTIGVILTGVSVLFRPCNMSVPLS